MGKTPRSTSYGSEAGPLIWMVPTTPLPYWAEKWEWYQDEPYCSARKRYLNECPGGMGHSVTPLAPSSGAVSWEILGGRGGGHTKLGALLVEAVPVDGGSAGVSNFGVLFRGEKTHPLVSSLLLTVTSIQSPQSAKIVGPATGK